MALQNILSPEPTFCNIAGGSKKRLIETSAQLIASQVAQVTTNQIYDALIAREQLGSTGLGDGIAIPHCRIPGCKQTIGSLVKLDKPVNFDVIDGTPRDLLFFLLVPENTNSGHLKSLRLLAEHFSNPEFCQKPCAANTAAQLYSAATSGL